VCVSLPCMLCVRKPLRLCVSVYWCALCLLLVSKSSNHPPPMVLACMVKLSAVGLVFRVSPNHASRVSPNHASRVSPIHLGLIMVRV